MIGRKLGLAALVLLYYMLGAYTTLRFDMRKWMNRITLWAIIFVLTVVTLHFYT